MGRSCFKGLPRLVRAAEGCLMYWQTIQNLHGQPAEIAAGTVINLATQTTGASAVLAQGAAHETPSTGSGLLGKTSLLYRQELSLQQLFEMDSQFLLD